MQTEEYRTIFDVVEERAEARGEVKGKAEGKAEALLAVLASRGVMLTTEQRELVMSCLDLEQVDRWFDRSLSATSADDVFKD